jgi:hypothetical protein
MVGRLAGENDLASMWKKAAVTYLWRSPGIWYEENVQQKTT